MKFKFIKGLTIVYIVYILYNYIFINERLFPIRELFVCMCVSATQI